MYELFDNEKINIDNYNIIQLADWIKKCRTAIKLSDKPVYSEDYGKYATDVYAFCENWKVYFEKHKDKCNSIEFSQALKLSVIPKPKYVLITSDRKEIDVSSDFEEMQLQNLVSFNLIYKSIDREKERIKYYSEKISTLLNDNEGDERGALKPILEYLCFNTITYKINILEKENILETKSKKQILSAVKRGKWYTDERKFKPKGYETFSDYLIDTIREKHINKNVYYAFSKNKEKDKKRVYEKQFLFNVGFYIGLTANEMERVLKNEGYTIQSSKREDDKIVYDCFRYFFPQQYASALLFKEGYDTLNIGK